MSIADVSGKPISALLSLHGKVAVVTGAAPGLGKAIAARLAEAGAAVIIGDLNLDSATRVAEELTNTHGVAVIPCQLDVTDEQSVSDAARLAKSTLGGLDVWVSNAGVYPNTRIFDTSAKDWDHVMAVHPRGVFLGAKVAASSMIENGQGGVIINIVSTAGFKGVAPGVSAYVASKHAVRGLTRQMAIELAPHDIRVLGVAPTFCDTEGNKAALAALPETVREEIAATTSSMLGRVGVPDDIARVVLFCASDMSLFMTGSTLLADAGETS